MLSHSAHFLVVINTVYPISALSFNFSTIFLNIRYVFIDLGTGKKLWGWGSGRYKTEFSHDFVINK